MDEHDDEAAEHEEKVDAETAKYKQASEYLLVVEILLGKYTGDMDCYH